MRKLKRSPMNVHHAYEVADVDLERLLDTAYDISALSVGFEAEVQEAVSINNEANYDLMPIVKIQLRNAILNYLVDLNLNCGELAEQALELSKIKRTRKTRNEYEEF
jgi:hypothetical protein